MASLTRLLSVPCPSSIHETENNMAQGTHHSTSPKRIYYNEPTTHTLYNTLSSQPRRRRTSPLCARFYSFGKSAKLTYICMRVSVDGMKKSVYERKQVSKRKRARRGTRRREHERREKQKSCTSESKAYGAYMYKGPDRERMRGKSIAR
jgi:hypothetical protein